MKKGLKEISAFEEIIKLLRDVFSLITFAIVVERNVTAESQFTAP